MDDETHEIRVCGYPCVEIFCVTCRTEDDDPLLLHRFDHRYAPTLLALNTVALNHFRDVVPPADVKLKPMEVPSD